MPRPGFRRASKVASQFAVVAAVRLGRDRERGAGFFVAFTLSLTLVAGANT